MPQLGETVAEGKISKWFVSAGDAVKPGDNLFEIETDKVSMEVPATEPSPEFPAVMLRRSLWQCSCMTTAGSGC